MVFLMRLFIVLILLLCCPMLIMAKEIKYNHNSKTISEIKNSVDFNILSPKKIPDDWTLDTKTSPWIMLHFMNSNDTKLIVAIHQRIGFSLSDDDYPYAHHVDINGNKGYFQEWANSGEVYKNGAIITGGKLNWVQNGTFIEMSSSILTKEKMIEIARSMN